MDVTAKKSARGNLKEDVTISYFTVGVSILAYFLSLVRLNPDPHHDGVQFAAAVGVADGLRIHSQVFEQYGPLGAWIQGATLKIFGSTLLNLRIENAILLTLAGLLLLRIFLILRLPKVVAVLSCLVWAVSCPVSSVSQGAFGFWPWSSVISTVFLLANASVLLKSQVIRKPLADWEIYLAGITCVLIMFTRFQVGIAATFVNLVLITLSLGTVDVNNRRSRVVKFLIALFLSTGYFVGILAMQGSIPSFVEQIISGPLRQYVNPFDWNYFKLYYVLASAPTLLSLLLLALLWRHLRGIARSILILPVSLFLGSFMFFGNWDDGAYLNKFATWSAILDVQGIAILFASVLFYLLLAFLALCYFLSNDFLYPLLSSQNAIGDTVRDIFKAFGRKPLQVAEYSSPQQLTRRRKMAVLGTLLLLEIPFLVQFYPIADVYHLWWAVPLFTPLIPFTLRHFVSRRGLTTIMSAVLVPALISSTIMFFSFIKVPRIEVIAGALKGMQVESQYVNSYSAIDQALRDLAPRSAQFFCRDGLMSTWTGSYLQVDSSYVNWAWVLNGQEIAREPSRIFACGSPEYVTSFAASRNLRVITSGIPFHLSFWSNDTLFELAK